MAIVIEMNRAGKRAWAQRMRGCRTVAARVRYSIVSAWATGAGSARAVAERVGCAPRTALRVAHRYLQDGEAGLWDHRQANGCRKVSGTVTDALRQKPRQHLLDLCGPLSLSLRDVRRRLKTFRRE